jgi:hypothetical protein
LTRDNQAQPGAANLPRGRTVDLRERLKQFRDVSHRNAEASISHADFDKGFNLLAARPQTVHHAGAEVDVA